MADNNIIQGLKDKVSNFANNIKSHASNLRDGTSHGFNPIKYDKLVSILDSLTAKARDLNSFKFEHLKTCINNLFNNLNTSKIYDLPSKDLDVIIEFAEELDGKFPKNNILADDYNRLISDLENSADKLTAVVEACRLYVSSITTTKKEDKMDDIVSTCRFIGIDIFKDHDGKYVETKRPADRTVRPPVLADGSEFTPVKSENVLKYLNQEGVFSKIQAHNFLKQFQTQYQKTLSESGLASSEVMKIASKYSVNSSQFKTFVLVDEFSRDNLLKDYLNNELIASGLSETIAQIEGDESLKSYDQMKLMLEDKLITVTMDSNKVIEKYVERLKVLDEAYSRESDASKKDAIQKDIDAIKEVGYRFVALKEICAKNRDVLLTMTPDAVSKIVDNLTVVLDNSRVYQVRLTPDTSIMTKEDCDKINTTLAGIEFTDFASLKRENKAPQQAEAQTEDEEEVEEEEEEEEIVVPPTSNMQMLRHIINICADEKFDETNLTSLAGVFRSISKSALAHKINNLENDLNLTISQWEDLLGFDIIKALSQFDTKGDPEKEEFKKNLVEAKLKGTKITLLDDQFKDDLKAMFKLPQPNDPSIRNSFIQLIRANNYAKSQGKRLEDLDKQELNKKVAEFKTDIDAGNVKPEEIDQAKKLSNDNDFLNWFISHGGSKDPEVYKKCSEKMDKFVNKDQLTEAAKELPATSEEIINQQEDPKYEVQTYAKKYAIPDNESLLKKLKGYNTKYLVKLIDDICKSIKKTVIWTEIKSEKSHESDESKLSQTDPVEEYPKKEDENKPEEQQNDDQDKGRSDEGKPENSPEQPSNNHHQEDQGNDKNEIETLMSWLNNHKDNILKTSSLINPEIEMNDVTRKMWFNLAAITGNNNAKLGQLLEEISQGNDSRIRTIIEQLHKTANQMDMSDKSENIHKVANDLKTYFNAIVDKNSATAKAFRDIVFNGENEFIFDPNINYIELIRQKTQFRKQEIEKKNEDLLNGFIEDIKKLKSLVGDKEAIWMIGRLATASEVRLMDDGKTTQLMQEREYILNDEKIKGETFSYLFKINPQALLTVLSAFPNDVLGYDKEYVYSEEKCADELAVAAFDEDYNIENNIETLTTIVGKEVADKYIKALSDAKTPEEKEDVIKRLQNKVNLPLDYLNNANSRKLLQLVRERGLQLTEQNEEQNTQDDENVLE